MYVCVRMCVPHGVCVPVHVCAVYVCVHMCVPVYVCIQLAHFIHS